MKSGFPNAHANHDESLVVRLYGDDLGAPERSRALELVAGCEECTALFADLGQIAAATAALPTPARPRDFSLTPEDAARLRPQRQEQGRFQWRGLSRSLGGAFAALGLAGILLAGASTLLAPAASLDNLSFSVAPQDQAGLQGVAVAGGGAQSGQPNAAAASADTGSITANPGGAKAVAGSAGPSAAPSLVLPPADSASLAIRAPASTPSAAQDGFGAQPLRPAQPASNESVDARPVVLIGSAALLLAGLLLLVWPRLRRRRLRG
jgi:hypothetical protein